MTKRESKKLEVTYADVQPVLSDLLEMCISETKLTKLQKLQLTYGPKSPVRDAMLQSKLDSVIGKVVPIDYVAHWVLCGICGSKSCNLSHRTYKVTH